MIMEYITAQSPGTKSLVWPQLDAILTWLKFWTITQASPWRSNIINCDPKNIWIILLDLVQLIQDTALLAYNVWVMWAESKLDLPNGWKLAQGRRVSKSMLEQTLQSPSWSLDASWILTSKWSIGDVGQACGGLYAHKMTRKKRRISCFLQFKSSHTFLLFLPHSSQGQGGDEMSSTESYLNPNMYNTLSNIITRHYDWLLCRKNQITSVRVCNISQRDFISLHFKLVIST